MKSTIKRILKSVGFYLERYNSCTVEAEQIRFLIHANSINCVFDVGANVGQFAEGLRKLGYQGEIISFEPIAECFSVLSKKAGLDPLWKVHNLALGDSEGTSVIQVSNNLVSSSLLKPVDHLPVLEGGISTAKEEIIQVARLDRFLDLCENKSVYLKVDVQGFEKEVLLGAEEYLSKVRIVQIETSLSSLYKEGSTITYILTSLEDQGFTPYNIVKGLSDPVTGKLFEVDLFFVRNGS